MSRESITAHSLSEPRYGLWGLMAAWQCGLAAAVLCLVMQIFEYGSKNLLPLMGWGALAAALLAGITVHIIAEEAANGIGRGSFQDVRNHALGGMLTAALIVYPAIYLALLIYSALADPTRPAWASAFEGAAKLGGESFWFRLSLLLIGLFSGIVTGCTNPQTTAVEQAKYWLVVRARQGGVIGFGVGAGAYLTLTLWIRHTVPGPANSLLQDVNRYIVLAISSVAVGVGAGLIHVFLRQRLLSSHDNESKHTLGNWPPLIGAFLVVNPVLTAMLLWIAGYPKHTFANPLLIEAASRVLLLTKGRLDVMVAIGLYAGMIFQSIRMVWAERVALNRKARFES